MVPFHVADWEGSSEGVRAELLSTTIRAGRFPELGMWTATLSPESRALLARAGFEPTDLDLRARGMPCVLLKRLGPPVAPDTWTLGGGSALDLSRWDMRLVYSMHG
jgi:hypothetical protein